MNFETLQDRVEKYVLDLPGDIGTLIPEWINMAIRRACERHNFLFMRETAPEQTTVEGQRKLMGLPTGWKETRGRPWLLHQDGGVTEIDWAPTESELIRMYGQAAPAEGNKASIDDGQPRFLFPRSDEIEVYPFPDDKSQWDDGNYRVYIPYWKFPTDLSNNSDTNWVTENMPFYIIFYAAAEGFVFNREEERAQLYFNRAEQKFRESRREDKLAQLPDRPTLIPKARAKGTRRRFRL